MVRACCFDFLGGGVNSRTGAKTNAWKKSRVVGGCGGDGEFAGAAGGLGEGEQGATNLFDRRGRRAVDANCEPGGRFPADRHGLGGRKRAGRETNYGRG